MPLKSYSQNNFTDAEVDAIFSKYKKFEELKKTNISLEFDLKFSDSISSVWKDKFIIQKDISNNQKAQNILLSQKVSNKDKEIKNQKTIWRSKRNSAYLKGGVIGAVAVIVAVVILN